MAKRKSNAGRAVVAIGAGAVLVWLLGRGRGWGGSEDGKSRGGDSGEASADSTGRTAPLGPPVHVWLRGDRIEVEGVESDLATAIERARATGLAYVYTTGDTIHGRIVDVVQALQRSGVEVATPTRLSESLRRDGLSTAHFSDDATR